MQVGSRIAGEDEELLVEYGNWLVRGYQLLVLGIMSHGSIGIMLLRTSTEDAIGEPWEMLILSANHRANGAG